MYTLQESNNLKLRWGGGAILVDICSTLQKNDAFLKVKNCSYEESYNCTTTYYQFTKKPATIPTTIYFDFVNLDEEGEIDYFNTEYPINNKIPVHVYKYEDEPIKMHIKIHSIYTSEDWLQDNFDYTNNYYELTSPDISDKYEMYIQCYYNY